MQWLPNFLTIVRILLTPLIIRDILDAHCTIAMPFAWIAGATDALDGYVARKMGAESRVGAWLDPLADKALLTGMYFSFGISGLAPMWLAWLVIGRDALILAMSAAGLAFTSIRDFPPSVWGKLSTVVQIGVSLLILAACNGTEWANRLSIWAVWAVAITAVWSGLHYVLRAIWLVRSTPAKV